MAEQTEHPLVGKICIVRTYTAGVHFGTVREINQSIMAPEVKQAAINGERLTELQQQVSLLRQRVIALERK